MVLNLKYLPVQLSLFLSIGIYIGYYVHPPINSLIAVLAAIILFLFYLHQSLNNAIKISYVFPFFTSISFLFVGWINTQLKSPFNQKSHYLQRLNKYQNSTIKITKPLKPTDYYLKYEGEVLKINRQNTTGKVLVTIKKGEKNRELNVDDLIISTNPLTKINKAKNPGEFDYREFLKKKGIYRKIVLKSDEFIVQKPKSNSLKGDAFKIRKKIKEDLKNYNFSKNELSVIHAILLGQRQDISKEVFDNYKNAGAIHILAVSGLHIGIILLLLNFLLKPIELFSYGRHIKLFLLILFLWLYAFIAGLSPSVVRAVAMFTAVAVGMLANQTFDVKKSLVLSFFVLLLINPLYLFDVGFQLSYIAVFSIVFIQPILTKLWKPKPKAINYLWQLLTVSFAAQIGILPLSLYYFHQFPTLFFISSLVIIPFLGIILGYGFIVILLSTLKLLPAFIAKGYEYSIHYMNKFVQLISDQEQFIFSNIFFSLFLTLCSYFILIAFVNYYYKRKYNLLVLILVSVLSIQGYLIYLKFKESRTNKILVYHLFNNTLIENKVNGKAFFYTGFDSLKAEEIRIIKFLKPRNKNVGSKMSKVKNYYKFQNKKVLIIDSLGIYQIKELKPEIIVLRQTPKINLERTIKFLNPKTIVADGSNYNKEILNWEKTCKKLNINFFNTAKNGAFQLSCTD